MSPPMTDFSGLRAHARRNLVAYLALGAALAATGGVAYSAIPDANSVIHGCYDNASGALRVIDTEASGICRGGETALDWNQKGQAGVPGAQGPQGPPGLATTYGKSSAGVVALPEAGQKKTVVTLTVPRGNYVIFAKAVGALAVPGFSCQPGTEIFYCSLLHNERRLAATIFGCAVQAGASSDLGRANLIAGANQQSAYQTVSANVMHTFQGASNKIALTCLQYAGGKWPASIHNARLIAMKVDQINPLSAFRAVAIKIPKAKRKPKLRAAP
jgi:hypothetical protein